MDALFYEILKMSFTGSLVILAVLVIRFFLKRFPKIFSYCLWAVVVFRLLCPVSLNSQVSLMALVPEEATTRYTTVAAQPITETVYHTTVDGDVQVIEEKPNPVRIAIPYLWLAGGTGLFLMGLFQYFRLRRSLSGSQKEEGNVSISASIPSPFVMGILLPRIYLPAGLSEAEKSFILAHEKHHIKRLDPLWKFLGYTALCLHWFNPLVWLAFFLAGRDMEMSCDEAVISRMGSHIRADYAQALLELATHRRHLAVMPLGFGEGDTKSRVRNMAKWKRPKVWVCILCAVLCLIVVAVCGLNPSQSGPNWNKGPTTIGMNYFHFQLPRGYAFQWYPDDQTADPESSLRIYKGNKVIGGVLTFQMPDGYSRPAELPFPEWEYDNLGYSADQGHVEFFDDVENGEEKRYHRTHYVYTFLGELYDLWFDELVVKPSEKQAILDTVSLKDSQWKLYWFNDTDFKPLMEGGDTLFRRNTDQKEVARFTSYPLPEEADISSENIFLWLNQVGNPDFSDPNLICTSATPTDDGGMALIYASRADVNAGAVRVHRVYIASGKLFDGWVDARELSESQQKEIFSYVIFLRSTQDGGVFLN